MKKYYYENLLISENIVARPNVAWAADITDFELTEGKRVWVYLCIDIYSNKIIVAIFRNRILTTADIIPKLREAIQERIPIKPRRELLIHTDRGTQFTSELYKQFVKEQKEFFRPSMSRKNKPKDNAVVERFIRTFKEHKLDNKTFQQELFYQIEMNGKFKGYRKMFNTFIKDINFNKPNKKTTPKAPDQLDRDASAASMLMLEPKYSKSFSEHFGSDFRRDYIKEYKAETNNVIGLLEEIEVKKAEIAEHTPWDLYEDKLALEVIDQRLESIYSLLMTHPETTRQYVEETILPLQDMLESMDDKINQLLPKPKRKRETLPLRDPVHTELFDIYRTSAGSQAKYKQDLKCAQLQVAYTILFYVGLRVNELRFFKRKDIDDAIKTSQFNVVHFKQKESHIHVISERAVDELKKLKNQLDVIFIKYKFEYLFGKNKPVDEKYLIKMINKDLKHTSEINNIPFNIKSHSFRINMVSQLLKKTSVQNAADIIGHKDIQSTMAYKRYALNKQEIQKLLNKIDQGD